MIKITRINNREKPPETLGALKPGMLFQFKNQLTPDLYLKTSGGYTHLTGDLKGCPRPEHAAPSGSNSPVTVYQGDIELTEL